MTDTLVLKNKLVMPQEGTYLELDQDEMEYVDGGAFSLTAMIKITGAAGWIISFACNALLLINEGHGLNWPLAAVISLRAVSILGIVLSTVAGIQQLFSNGVMYNVTYNILTNWLKFSGQKASWIWGIMKGMSLGNGVRKLINGR